MKYKRMRSIHCELRTDWFPNGNSSKQLPNDVGTILLHIESPWLILCVEATKAICLVPCSLAVGFGPLRLQATQAAQAAHAQATQAAQAAQAVHAAQAAQAAHAAQAAQIAQARAAQAAQALQAAQQAQQAAQAAEVQRAQAAVQAAHAAQAAPAQAEAAGTWLGHSFKQADLWHGEWVWFCCWAYGFYMVLQ